MLLVVDIDGVLADIRPLLPLIKADERGRKDFTAYDALIETAQPIPQGIELLKLLMLHYGPCFGNHQGVVFITGRKESSHDETQRWLVKHLTTDCKYKPLLMRPRKCWEPAWKVKERHVLALQQQGRWVSGRVIAIEDDAQCCAMYRKHGAYVLQAHNDASRSNGAENE